MIEELKHIEKTILMDLLRNPSIWNTLDVNYHPPRVERLFTQIAECRLMLHILHPCTAEESLYHPHPWPSAIHVLNGKYEMGLGVRIPELIKGPGIKILDRLDDKGNKVIINEICRLELQGSNYYVMPNALGWHQVVPKEEPCVSLMLIGPGFDEKDDQDIPKAWGELPLIEEPRKLEILENVKELVWMQMKIEEMRKIME